MKELITEAKSIDEDTVYRRSSNLCTEMNFFLDKIEALLEMRKQGRMDERTFISCGYGLLIKLYDQGFEKDYVYQTLLAQFVQLQDCDEFKSDLLADLMDFVVGWCSSCNRIWDSEGKFDRTK